MDKTKIEALQKRAQERVDKAKTADEAKAATEELEAITQIGKEADELEKENSSLLTAYKEAIRGQPIKLSKDEEPIEKSGEPLEFDEALKKIMDARKS